MKALNFLTLTAVLIFSTSSFAGNNAFCKNQNNKLLLTGKNTNPNKVYQAAKPEIKRAGSVNSLNPQTR